MNHALKVTRLHLNKPQTMFGTPTFIVLTVLVLIALVALVLQRAGVDPTSSNYAEGIRFNQAMVFSLPGFLIYYGVQATATTLPFTLALGATRRAHVMGTAIAHLILAAYVSAMMVVLLWMELATGHWFANVYALDTYVLGSGNPWVLAVTVFIGVFVCTSIGGAFGAVWVRWGSRGPITVALVLAVILAALLLAFVPQATEILSAITRPLLAAVAVGIAIICLVGTWLAMRRTAVR